MQLPHPLRQVLLAVCLGALAPTPLADEADYAKQRASMVENQLANRGIADEAVLQAIATVPRHQFVPPDYRSRAYDDTPLPIGHGQTISQPYIVAAMTELVNPSPQARVLEIGSGSGYQAAVLAELVAQVYTIEIVPALAEQAGVLLADSGYDNVQLRQGDGYYGWQEHAPFDAIVVTAAAQYIPPPLLEQLKPGGRMIIPVGSPFMVQRLMLVEKDAAGETTSRSVMSVRFVPFTRE